MAKNLRLRIKVEFVETEAEASVDRHPQEQADGSFSLVLPEADELNLSVLDRAALDVSFPALREALSRHLAAAGKKSFSVSSDD
jgi:predicted RNA-binding Zn ribbon-like protein